MTRNEHRAACDEGLSNEATSAEIGGASREPAVITVLLETLFDDLHSLYRAIIYSQ